jgi:hypothetical protein
VEASVKARDYLACFDVGQRREVRRTQPLQKHGAAWRVGTEQADGAIAGPSPQREVLVFGLSVVRADLEDGLRAVGRPHR